MNCFYLLIILVLIYLLNILFEQNKNETFTPFQTTNQMYNIGKPDNFQIGHVYHPFYNRPKYIGKYPYYKYLFHPYGYSTYY